MSAHGMALVACTANLTGSDESGAAGDDGTAEEQALSPFEPHGAMLKRLTRTQFRNAIIELTGFTVNLEDLPEDSHNGHFAVVGATTVATPQLGVEQYLTAVEAAVESAFSDEARRQELLGCTPTAPDDACVARFVERVGRRAWRRPLSSAEIDRLLGVARTAGTTLEGAIEGPHWAMVALLTSPHFLYRPELGTSDEDGGYRLTDYELASRLAFLIWNALPDEQLLDEAETGVLSATKGLLAATRRMLEDPRGREAVAAFAEDYMRLDRVATQPKDAGLFPEYGPALQEAMVRDMREVWVLEAFDEDSSVLDVFTTKKVVANAELAALYGLDASGLDSDTYAMMTLPDDGPRTGILSRAGFLSQFANQKEGSPTLRGKFIREALMCGHIPPPPGNIALELPESSESAPATKRDRLEWHSTEPACAGCHQLMDPLGLPLEAFDAVGRFRTNEHGLPIDPSGEFDGVPVGDSRELGVAVGASEMVASCIVRKYYSYAVGHEVRAVDEIVVHQLAQAFAESGNRFRALILDVVASDAFSAVAPHP